MFVFVLLDERERSQSRIQRWDSSEDHAGPRTSIKSAVTVIHAKVARRLKSVKETPVNITPTDRTVNVPYCLLFLVPNLAAGKQFNFAFNFNCYFKLPTPITRAFWGFECLQMNEFSRRTGFAHHGDRRSRSLSLLLTTTSSGDLATLGSLRLSGSWFSWLGGLLGLSPTLVSVVVYLSWVLQRDSYLPLY
ncbi:hypothetical protein C8R47DRAFT_1238192 [Mycena vitilis]|nr:hypothetical protein C8R47DRAFT_1238192 [Mycena vitilis]